MVQINFAAREINCKVVYYGPGRSGKTTNLEQIHATSPKPCVGEMVSIATETDRTLFFDFLPLDIGKVAGMQVRFQLYTVPGQVYYNATRKLVLQGVDGVIFVADSQRSMMEENTESLLNLYDNLKENGYDADSIPVAFQWNKRDLPDILSTDELQRVLNPKGLPASEAVAFKGIGVIDTLKSIAGLVLDRLMKEYGGAAKDRQAAPGRPGTPAPAPPATTAPGQASPTGAAPPQAQRPTSSQPAAPPASGPQPAPFSPEVHRPAAAVPTQPKPGGPPPSPVVAQPPKPVIAVEAKPPAPQRTAAPSRPEPAPARAIPHAAQKGRGKADRNKWVLWIIIGSVVVITALVYVLITVMSN